MSFHEFLQSGDFKTRLTLEAQTSISDGCGGYTHTWIEQFDLWARIVPIEGILVSKAGGVQSEHTHWIYMRMRDGIASGMRFRALSRVFDIETLCDPDETGRYLLCKVREVS